MDDKKDYAVTIFGLAALQTPTLISAAPKESMLSSLQVLGFPFNLSQQFMKDHVTFSPGNVLAGRYYTMVTSIFHHTRPNHLVQNMSVLAASGRQVHKIVGRKHFLAIFTGGGVFGNLGMWVYYLMQRSRLHSRLLAMDNSPVLAKNEFLQKLKRIDLNTVFDFLNYTLLCNGSSAGVNAILSFGACCSAERIVARLQECWKARNFELDIYFFIHVMNIVFAFDFFLADTKNIIRKFAPSYKLFEQLSEGHCNTTGDGGHLAGTLFGLSYYYLMYLRK